ncbi:MAG: isoprenyl transferase [Deltaproteobacteria bacterium]|nr:isoprenyl transferase [Deltaproteobacteria bacterium]MBW1813016.1 isoprenyl transferase [Deltaproteobacteria bacterium]MBW1847296.1 isoprenyl transferase [Deltaproteobacteria bacterium]MBW2179754.1 isoprenyl transferase [Deltaproteobacteria bacterium]
MDAGLDFSRLPVHVAIIMDGNGRWAKKRRLNRIKGHEKGAETVRMVLRTFRKIGIPNLTLFAFSTENWQRPKTEVAALMRLLKKFLLSEEQEMIENNIRLNAIGQLERFPEDVQKSIQKVMGSTEQNDGLLLSIALSYGGRADIQKMVYDIAAKVKTGKIDPAEITPELISNHLYTRSVPDPDLLIRTSGEMRISNFYLWQIAYTELYMTKTLWPDFSKEECIGILKEYQQRNRRYGNIEE